MCVWSWKKGVSASWHAMGEGGPAQAAESVKRLGACEGHDFSDLNWAHSKWSLYQFR